ncbi:probable carboxylesterase 12 [Prosopis cineraria]|uniref:probable carboxylesterase 12 n=1 Tax=Prosopis cineraria TaxID=364024 RepID=UPI00240F19CE|nr:probable carboxylesterase 12 [Prosopis cineraria]
MDSSSTEVANAYPSRLKLYKDGRVQRLVGIDFVPPSLDDPNTEVRSHDAVISQEAPISARLFAPKVIDYEQKLPLLVYFHGGGFVTETPFTARYHNYVNSVVSSANVVAVSVHYRRAPEHPVPTAFEDSWTSIQWVASHSGGNGTEELLNHHVDFERVFFAGDSAGANISHHMAIRVGREGLPGVNLEGIVLIHPYFWGAESLESEKIDAGLRSKVDSRWRFVCPTTEGSDDPLINPAKDPNLGCLGCRKILVCLAEKDMFKERGRYYKEMVEKSGWKGMVEVMEAMDQDHAFHLFNPTCDNALVMLMNSIVSFINHN